MNSTRLRIGLTAAVAALAGLLGVQTGEAQTMASLPPPAAAAETLGEARPLLAWIDFCRRRPSECTVDTNEPATVALTPRTWQTIASVNRKVNAAIKPMIRTPADGVGLGFSGIEDADRLKRHESGRRAMAHVADYLSV